MQRNTELESLEVRNYSSLKWKTLIVLLLFIAATISIIIQIASKDFWIHFKSSSVYYFIGLVIMIFGIIYYSKSLYYDKELQLKIDNEGIWTPKYKTWKWEDIWYFNTKDEFTGNGDRLNTLEVKLKEGTKNGKEYLLFPLDNYDKPKEQIRKILERYAALNNIQDLGHEIIN